MTIITARTVRKLRAAAVASAIALVASTNSFAQSTSTVPCPPIFRRPVALQYIQELSQRLELQRSQWTSSGVVVLINNELRSALRFSVPFEEAAAYENELAYIGRETIAACWPAIAIFIAELDAAGSGFVPARVAAGGLPGRSTAGVTTPVPLPSADELSRREADLARWQDKEARAKAERDEYVRAQTAQEEAARLAAAEELRRQALAAEEAEREVLRQREDEMAKLRAAQQRARKEREDQSRAQIAARKAAEEQRQAAVEERRRIAEERREAALAADKEIVGRSVDWTPERRMIAAYRRFAIVQQCYDAFASNWFGEVFLTRNQLAVAKSFIPAIEAGLSKLASNLNKSAMRTVAEAEERLLATDLDIGTYTPRGPIRQKEWNENSRAFCEEQVGALRMESLELQSTRR